MIFLVLDNISFEWSNELLEPSNRAESTFFLPYGILVDGYLKTVNGMCYDTPQEKIENFSFLGEVLFGGFDGSSKQDALEQPKVTQKHIFAFIAAWLK